ncbi:threonine--tRNA ligase [Reticulibacter mediterranei]|uniref:Threonine--tRNA ligase n=1 Tax=Reticulibacter mediterranei TaxID=2778369 RepID=A0A8J3IN67_9CHLR|nr:threonine--tRNA ligase [Reticulibacter mediterranei]GHO92481.1 threonine--tRNA ligase [Reticulibacter mediterranei]
MSFEGALEESVSYSPLQRMRHSAAHVMAEAVQEMFPDAQFAIGPAIEDGFYYDFALPRSLTPDDLPEIERRMQRIIAAKYPFVQDRWPREKALEYFRQRRQPYKVEIIEHLFDQEVGIYQQGNFLDLCRGPHVENTGQIGPFKLMRIAGAYWRGDEMRDRLQRIYGTAWFSQEELDQYLWQLEEAQKRDHRKLGRELELFHFDATAPGMPYWLPRGFKVLLELINFWRVEHEKRGYQEISAPLINERTVWETSGHLPHYADNMFLLSINGVINGYGIKAMNCPNAMMVFNFKTRSYRDLPLRLADCDILHRHERSGTLHGLLRVQKFTQDDAHVFVAEEQLEDEYERILKDIDFFYSIFDLKYSLRLGTRPDSYIGDMETWNRAEAILRHILDKYAGAGNYAVEEGDGAFYGPKIDILMEDALGRSWQMGTIQLDFQMPRRFQCAYIDRDGSQRTPVVIHRVIYGSLERFIGILIEHTAGAFPVWLAPIQAMLIPIADRHAAYAERVREVLREAGIRVEVDARNERMNARIRDAQLQKIPYMLIVGDQEEAASAVSVRLRSNVNLKSIPLDQFRAQASQIIKARSKDLWPQEAQ